MSKIDKDTKEHIQTLLDGKLDDKCSYKIVGTSFLNLCQVVIDVNKLNKFDLIIGYDDFFKTFIIWNARVHTARENANTHSFSCDIKGNYDLIQSKPIYPIYKSLQRNGYYEKILIIDEKYIGDFCKHWFEYMIPCENDIGFNPKVIFWDKKIMCWNEMKNTLYERNRITCSRAERNIHFRENVLESYDKKCAICRCSEEKVLQAAHILAVQDGGDDDIKNGVCLCANHHLMLDNGLIKIDFENLTLSYISSPLKKHRWYEDFVKDYHGKIIKQKLN